MKYKVGEILYAPSGPLLYKCKVLDTRTNDEGKPQYFIHYHNWNKNWDEWQQEEALHPDTEETLKTVKSLKEEHKRKKKRAGSGKTAGRRKKRKTSGDEKIEVLHQIAFEIPNWLKKRLQHQNDLIHRENTKLPYEIPSRDPTVRKILQEFHDEVMGAACESNLKRHMTEMKNGLIFYFEQSFTRNLLYTREKKRWKTFLSNTGKQAIDSCGVNFLLRLLLKLPALCAFSTLDPEQINVIKGVCQALLRYLRDNSKRYGLEDCVPPHSKHE